ncbi:MAG: TatD family hydrolase [Verrucomicrobiales bacterium]|jgi:TatD DNase family protein|nr:TatD family hydrolase [Verrucomicrobiales bacterium]
MLIDTHAHMDFPDFAEDRPATLQRAKDAGVERIITIGTDVASSRRAISLAEQHDMIYAAVGIHPCHARDADDAAARQLEPLLAHPKVVAVGECGLDYYHETGGVARQKLFFQQQLALAADHGLNVIIHQRHSWDDTLAALVPWHGKLRAVFHCFGESLERASLLLRHNHLVSFTGIVTFKNAQVVRDTVSALPDDTFMLETDCPYLAPVPHRGKRCEPAFVRHTAETIAGLRKQSLSALLAATARTAENFFHFHKKIVGR